MKKAILFSFLVSVLTGCGVRAPLTQYTDARVTQSTAVAIAFDANFEISNTNDEPLKLKFYDYTVAANGKTVYNGRASAEQTVPRWATVRGSVPVVIRRENLSGEEEVLWTLSGRLTYIPPTAIAETLLNTGIWEPSIHVQARDSLQIPQYPFPTN